MAAVHQSCRIIFPLTLLISFSVLFLVLNFLVYSVFQPVMYCNVFQKYIALVPVKSYCYGKMMKLMICIGCVCG